MRWHPHADMVAGLTTAQRAAFDTASWYEMLVLPMAGWLLWAVPYYMLIFVLLKRRIQGRGYPNMFTASDLCLRAAPALCLHGAPATLARRPCSLPCLCQ